MSFDFALPLILELIDYFTNFLYLDTVQMLCSAIAFNLKIPDLSYLEMR